MQGYFEDGLKALVYLMPLVYLIARRNKIKYFWLLFLGLFLLFLGHLLDFFDEFARLNPVFIIGRDCPWHDFFEDSLGATLGFIFFILGIYLNLKENK